MSDAAQVVRDFLGLLEAGRADEAIELVTEDVEWRNSGCPTLRGKRVKETLKMLERRGIHFSADMHHLAADGDVVLTDRTDHLGYGRFRASFWVCGTFEVRDGRIALWDDHFSTRNVLIGTVRGMAGMLRASGAARRR